MITFAISGWLVLAIILIAIFCFLAYAAFMVIGVIVLAIKELIQKATGGKPEEHSKERASGGHYECILL